MLNWVKSRHGQRMDMEVIEAYIKILTHCIYQDINTLSIL
jgi:Bcl2-/adenovirus E1B nineteen kDa-interacting protein 2.